MRIFKSLLGLVAVACVVSACSLFEDQTPNFITFRMEGPAGEQVTILYSKQFVAGVDETGTTRVEIFRADTVVHLLPIDTVIDVRLEQRLYLNARPLPTDTIAVDVVIDVDGRGLFDGVGDLFPTFPWQFLYQFNVPFTEDIEVVI